MPAQAIESFPHIAHNWDGWLDCQFGRKGGIPMCGGELTRGCPGVFPAVTCLWGGSCGNPIFGAAKGESLPPVNGVLLPPCARGASHGHSHWAIQ